MSIKEELWILHALWVYAYSEIAGKELKLKRQSKFRLAGEYAFLKEKWYRVDGGSAQLTNSWDLL